MLDFGFLFAQNDGDNIEAHLFGSLGLFNKRTHNRNDLSLLTPRYGGKWSAKGCRFSRFYFGCNQLILMSGNDVDLSSTVTKVFM